MFTEKTIKYVAYVNTLALKLQQLKLAEVFVNYSGHTNQLDVRIFSGRWNDWRDTDSPFSHPLNLSITLYMDFEGDDCFHELKFFKFTNYLASCVFDEKLIEYKP